MEWMNELVEIPRYVGIFQFLCLMGLFVIQAVIVRAKKREIQKLKLMIKPDTEAGQSQDENYHKPVK